MRRRPSRAAARAMSTRQAGTDPTDPTGRPASRGTCPRGPTPLPRGERSRLTPFQVELEQGRVLAAADEGPTGGPDVGVNRLVSPWTPAYDMSAGLKEQTGGRAP